jgi:sacsin
VEGDDPESRDLRTCLRKLGLPVVRLDGQIPDALRKIFQNTTYPRLNLPNVLSALSRIGPPIPTLFVSLNDEELWKVFANWARANITQIPENHVSLAQSLPIWWSVGGENRRALRPASEVKLLPQNFTLQDGAEFMADCVADDASLMHLKKKHMTPEQLPYELGLPDVLDMPTLLRYKQLYKTWIRNLPISCRQPLLAPTSAYTLRSPKDLFERGPLFAAVFPADSPFFVHPEFQEFEEILCQQFGLKSENNLDASMFTACAESLDLDDPESVPHAREVFRAYSHILPNHVEEDRWHELDDIMFIPRRMDTARRLPEQDENESGLSLPMSVTQSPAILSPADFVRQEYEALAWSQRACFEVQPSRKICDSYPELGRPTFSVVVRRYIPYRAR